MIGSTTGKLSFNATLVGVRSTFATSNLGFG